MSEQPTTAPRLRVAPSPTGDPHVGTAYMSLFNLAFARQQGGSFVLRIEDTDRARFREDSEQQVFDTLHWLGLHVGRGARRRRAVRALPPVRAARHLPPVRRAAARRGQGLPLLVLHRAARADARRAAEGQAAHRLRPALRRQDPRGARRAARASARRPVVRMLVPDDVELTFDDLIRGRVSAPRPDDQVILKADGFPTYHLAVVVDDHEMGITHVVRGEEWISSTPKHILLYQWLGLEPPQFAHMPLLRNTDKSKISKRKNPAARLTWFQRAGLPARGAGQLPRAAGLPAEAEGAEGEDVEVFTFEEFSADFDWAKVNPVGPIFDLKKLDWLNGVHIREPRGRRPRLAAAAVPRSADGVLADNPSLGELARLRSVTELIQTRMALLTEAHRPRARRSSSRDDALEIAEDARAPAQGRRRPTSSTAAIEALGDVDDERSGVLGSESGVDGRGHRGGAARRRSSRARASSRSSPSGRCARRCRGSG